MCAAQSFILAGDTAVYLCASVGHVCTLMFMWKTQASPGYYSLGTVHHFYLLVLEVESLTVELGKGDWTGRPVSSRNLLAFPTKVLGLETCIINDWLG